ncbi:MAG: XrtA-associated tyrosine autokinase [Gammaproteobacteria bacterium]
MSLIERFMEKLEGGGEPRRPEKKPPPRVEDPVPAQSRMDPAVAPAVPSPGAVAAEASGDHDVRTVVIPDGFDAEPRPLFDVASFGFDGDGREEDWLAVDYVGSEGSVQVAADDTSGESGQGNSLAQADAQSVGPESRPERQPEARDENDIFGTPPEFLDEIDAIERGLPVDAGMEAFGTVERAADALGGEPTVTSEVDETQAADSHHRAVSAGGEDDQGSEGTERALSRGRAGGPSAGGEEDTPSEAPDEADGGAEPARNADSNKPETESRGHPTKRRRIRGRGPSAGGEEELGSGGEDDDPLADIDPDELSPELRAELDEFISPPKAKVVKALATSGEGRDGAVGVTPQLILDDDEDYEPDEGSGFRAVNHVELNLDRLREMGMVTPDSARGKIAEEYRMIKRPLLQNILGDGERQFDNPNLIMVTSSVPGEGKTFTSVNLAMSLAMELDRTVLLVDADVAKPSFARLFDMETEAGLIDVLLEDASMRDVLLTTNVPKLRLMPAGRRHPNSVELLASDGMRTLAQEMAQRYPDRIIVFDSPPLLVTSEAAVLASLMSQIVVVAEANKTPQFVLQDSLNLLDKSKFIGLVLNKARPNARSGYYYDYRYPYYYGYYGYGQ